MCEYCEKPNKMIMMHLLGISVFVGAGRLILRSYNKELNRTIVSRTKINFFTMCVRKFED